jgi:antitoxin component of MazEF toxin-antitoxin module
MERKKILRVGDSAAITLPSKFVREVRWKPGQEVLVETDARTETIVVRSAKRAGAGRISPAFATWVEEFIDQHRTLLKELARR